MDFEQEYNRLKFVMELIAKTPTVGSDGKIILNVGQVFQQMAINALMSESPLAAARTEVTMK